MHLQFPLWRKIESFLLAQFFPARPTAAVQFPIFQLFFSSYFRGLNSKLYFKMKMTLIFIMRIYKVNGFFRYFSFVHIHKVVHKCNESCTKCTTKGIRTTEKEYQRFISYKSRKRHTKLILFFLFVFFCQRKKI